jgi:hypothetical protein
VVKLNPVAKRRNQMANTFTLTIGPGKDASKRVRHLFSIAPETAADRASAVAALAQAGWVLPGVYTTDLEFGAETKNADQATAASRGLQALGFKLTHVDQSRWDNRPGAINF